MTSTSSPITALPFDDAWTPADSAALLAIVLKGDLNNPDEAERKAARDATWQTLGQVGKAAYGHLLHLAQNGQLAPFQHCEGRRIETVNLWNTLANRTPFTRWQSAEQAEHLFTQILNASLSYRLMFPRKEWREQPELFDQALRSLARDGNFDRLEHEAYCFVTGHRHRIRLENWRPVLLQINVQRRLEPVTDNGPGEQMDTTTVAFPSGEVLASDWIRLEGFTKLDKAREQRVSYEGEDIGCEQGRMDAVRGCAAEGYLYVHGGGERQLFQREGHLVVGYTDPNDTVSPAGKNHKKINGPLRGTLLIDRAVLEAKLVEADPAKTLAEAKAEVAAYVADKSNAVHRIQVQPGTHHLYFSGGSYTMKKQFASPEVDMAHLEPLFVLSDHPLTLGPDTPTPEAPKRARRMR